MPFNSFFGFLILVIDVFAILKIANSSEPTLLKVIWILVVLILPVIGLIVWYLSGPGDKSFKF